MTGRQMVMWERVLGLISMMLHLLAPFSLPTTGVSSQYRFGGEYLSQYFEVGPHIRTYSWVLVHKCLWCTASGWYWYCVILTYKSMASSTSSVCSCMCIGWWVCTPVQLNSTVVQQQCATDPSCHLLYCTCMKLTTTCKKRKPWILLL